MRNEYDANRELAASRHVGQSRPAYTPPPRFPWRIVRAIGACFAQALTAASWFALLLVLLVAAFGGAA